jgi:excisionase family DNA binding protein
VLEDVEKMTNSFNSLSEKIENLCLSGRTWLTPMQVADYLGLSVNTVYQYVSKGRIPSHKIPNSTKLIFNRQEIDEWIFGKNKNESESTAEQIWQSLQ